MGRPLHLRAWSPFADQPMLIIDRGYLGMDFFFLLSGFILAARPAGEFVGAYSLCVHIGFAVKRFGRLFPSPPRCPAGAARRHLASRRAAILVDAYRDRGGAYPPVRRDPHTFCRAERAGLVDQQRMGGKPLFSGLRGRHRICTRFGAEAGAVRLVAVRALIVAHRRHGRWISPRELPLAARAMLCRVRARHDLVD